MTIKFNAEIDCDNDEFKPEPHRALAFILREIADDLDAGLDSARVRDGNGNMVGSWLIS